MPLRWAAPVRTASRDAAMSARRLSCRTPRGEVTATAYHPFWVIDGHELDTRPRPKELSEDEDEGHALSGRLCPGFLRSQCPVTPVEAASHRTTCPNPSRRATIEPNRIGLNHRQPKRDRRRRRRYRHQLGQRQWLHHHWPRCRQRWGGDGGVTSPPPATPGTLPWEEVASVGEEGGVIIRQACCYLLRRLLRSCPQWQS